MLTSFQVLGRIRMIGSMALVIVGLLCSTQRAMADLVFNFTGTVTEVIDPLNTSLWSNTAVVGAPVTGSFGYDVSAVPGQVSGVSGNGTAFWNLPIVPGGPNLMKMSVGGIQLDNFSRISVEGLQYPDPAGGFFFSMYNPSGLNLAGLQSGYTARFARVDLNFVSNNPSLGSLSVLPTDFNPLSQWNYPGYEATGSGIAFIFDPAGADVGVTFLNFSLTSVTAVPEPSSVSMLAAGMVALYGSRRFRRRRS